MERKKMSSRVFTFLTAVALLLSFFVQNWTVGAADAVQGVTLDSASILVDGKELQDGQVLKNGQNLEVKLNWKLNNSYSGADFTYPLNAIGLSVSAASGKLIAADGKSVIGSYEVDQNNVYIHLNEDFQKETERSVWVRFDGVVSVDEDKVADGEKTDISIADKKIQVEMSYPESSLKAAKSANGKSYVSGDAIYQDFKIELTATGKVSDITLRDILGSDLSDISNIKLDGESVTVTEGENGFELSLPSMSNETKTLTYTVKVADSVLDQASDVSSDAFKNTLKYEYKDNKDNDHPSGSASANVDVNKPSVSKNGSLSGNTVTWTIEFRGGLAGLDNVSIKDVFDSTQQSYDGDFPYANASLADLIASGDPNLTPITEWVDGAQQVTGYKLVYKTTVSDDVMDSVAQRPVKNDVTVDFDGREYTANGTVHTEGTDISDKTFEGLTEDNKMKWKITVDIPEEGLKSITVEDKLEVYNYAQQTVVEGSVTVNGVDASTVANITMGYMNYSFKLSDFSAEFLEANKGKTVTVEYLTQAVNESDIHNVNKKFHNDANIAYTDIDGNPGENKTSADYQYTAFTFVSKKANYDGDIYGSPDKLGWQITANLSDLSFKAGDVIKLSDTMPDNMKYVDGSLTAAFYWIKDSYFSAKQTDIDASHVSTSYNSETGKLEISYTLTEEDIAALNEKLAANNISSELRKNISVDFVYQTQIIDYSKFLSDPDAVYKNNVESEYNGEKALDASCSQKLTPQQVLDKNYIYSQANSDSNLEFGYTGDRANVKYTVDINKPQYTLSTTGKIQAVDKMGSSLSLIMNSVVVKDGNTGAVLDKSEYSVTADFDTNTYTYTVPDGRYLILEYWASIKKNVGDALGGDEVSNTIKLVGYNSTQSGDSNVVQGVVLSSKGGGGSDTKFITLYKFWSNEGDYTALSGAKFRVCQVTYDKTTQKFTEVEGTEQIVQIPESGSVMISNLQHDRIYQLMEVSAPDGFKRDAKPYYFVFSGYDKTELPDNVDEFVNGENHYFENEQKSNETVTLEGAKIWEDNNDALSIRPDNVEIIVKNGSSVVDPADYTFEWLAKSGNEWTFKVSELPKFDDDGVEIKYTLEEKPVDGYDTAVNGTTITNTVNVDDSTVDIEGDKLWNDDNDKLGIRPESVTILLIRDTVPVDSMTVSAANGWKYSFKDLPKYHYVRNANGTVSQIAYSYSVNEEPVYGYDPTFTQDLSSITNKITVTEDSTSVAGKKIWNDSNNALGVRPDNVNVKLYQDGKEYALTTVTADNGWEYEFKDLPKYSYSRNDNGTLSTHQYVYTVQEVAAAGYISEVNGYDITNTIDYTPETVDVSGTKTWADNDNKDGVRPENISVILYANGSVTNYVPTWTKSGNKWTYKFTGLPKYSGFTIDSNNNVVGDGEIAYTVAEALPKEYEGFYTAAKSGFDFTNTLANEKVKLEGSKTWLDGNSPARPSSITFTVTADGETVDPGKYTVGWTLTSDQPNVWYYSIQGLDKYKYSMVGGVPTKTEIKYSVSENPVDGYISSADNGNFTNTLKTSIPVEKEWVDDDNAAQARPDSIEVTLFANGNVAATKTITAADDWKYTFTDLPAYDANGKIVYTVAESPVENYAVDYSTSGDKLIIKNTLSNDITSVVVTKTWQDNGYEDQVRPDSLKVTLYANNVEGPVNAVPTIQKNDNVWTYTFSNLPKYYYLNGVKTFIEYTAVEDIPALYEQTKNTKSDENGITRYEFENTFTAEKTEVNGTKTWLNDNAALRPDSIEVTLFKNGVATNETAVWSNTDSSKWTYTFGMLDKYSYVKAADGTVTAVENVYTVVETPVENYTPAVNGFDITNTYVETFTNVSGTKFWANDADETEKYRPESVELELYADGVKVDGAVPVWTDTDTNEWHYEFSNLPEKNADGTIIKYTVLEANVSDNYDVSYNGNDITNTRKSVVEITKTDIADGETLEDAVLRITDGENVIDEWTSAKEAHVIIGKLEAGKTYTLTEVKAPDGYSVAAPVDFTVNADGTITKVIITDAVTKTEIQKIDATTGEAVAGAKFKLTDKAGIKVWEWMSGDDGYDENEKPLPHVIEGLIGGEEYILTEVEAPEGYALAAEPVRFTVSTDGSVTVVTMTNALTQTAIQKIDAVSGEALAGAKFKLTDAAGLKVWEWTSGDDGYDENGKLLPHVIEGLISGEEYVLTEVEAPEGYVLAAEPVKFTVNADGTVTNVTMTNSKADGNSSDETPEGSSDDTPDGSSDESSDVSSDESSDVSSDESSDVSSDESSDVSSDESSDVSSDESSETSSETSTSSEQSSSDTDSSSMTSTDTSSQTDDTPNTGAFAGSACTALALVLLAAATVVKKNK